MKARIAFETRVLAGFSAAVIVVAGLSLTTWIVTRNAAEATRWVVHTHDVLGSLARVKSDSLNVELTTQNFRLTGDASLLDERNAIIASRELSMERIRQLASNNASQMARYAELRALIDERVAIARRIETIRRTEGAEAAARFVATAPLKATRERVYKLLADMEAEEHRLLDIRMANDMQAAHQVVVNNVIAAMLLAALLAATYLIIRRQAREMEGNRRALAEREEQLAITLRSIDDAVLSTDNQGCVVRMNPLAERMTGWTFEDASGRPVADVFRVISESTRKPAPTAVETVLSTGQLARLAEQTTLLARDGSETPVAGSAAPTRDRGGRTMGAVLVFRDESSARRARQSIQAQNELLESRVQERLAELRESQAHLLSLISTVPAAIAFIDADQRLVYANTKYMADHAVHAITGQTVREMVGEDRYPTIAPLIASALGGEQLSHDWQPSPDAWQVVSYVPRFNERNAVIGCYVLGSDITDRKLAEQKIQLLNDKLTQHVRDLEHVSRALRTLSAGNRSMLHALDESNLLDTMCKAIVAAGGYQMACVWYRPDVPGAFLEPVAQTGHPGGMEALHRIRDQGGGDPEAPTAVAAAIRTDESHVVRRLQDQPAYVPWKAETAIYGSCVATPLRVGGKTIGALAIYSSRDDDFSADEVDLLAESSDDMAFGIASFRARAEQEKIQHAMHQLTYFDDVTGLPNEAQFTRIVAAAIEAGQQDGQRFAILQASIERLREINEVLGFSHGDQLLKLFGNCLGAVVPAGAVVSRLRGDEFAVLLPDSGVAEALEMARQIELALANPFPIADLPIEVSARIGISVFPEHGVTVHDLFRHMDIAVNHARKHGLRHAVFEPAYSRGQAARLVMVGELRRATDASHLRIYLQPKIDMRTGMVSGAEALVRWQHASRGLILPGEFIALAEQTALIKPLTNWIIDAAVQLGLAWKGQPHGLPIAINLSAPCLRDDALLTKIRGMQPVLATMPGMLEMELTESMLMEDAEYALTMLHALRAEHIQFYIDDFGTGYSSLSYLQRLPVEHIKIDRSFVDSMLDNEDSAAIVRSTIDLAHDLGLSVVAEGVATQAHWDRLQAYGCDVAQGYFIAKPMPSEEFPAWVKNYRAPGITRTA